MHMRTDYSIPFMQLDFNQYQSAAFSPPQVAFLLPEQGILHCPLSNSLSYFVAGFIVSVQMHFSPANNPA